MNVPRQYCRKAGKDSSSSADGARKTITMNGEQVNNNILADYRETRGNLITLLQRIQDAYGFISQESVGWFSRRLDVPASKFFGIITFYPKFRTKPVGKNTITICCGAACHIKGGDKIYETAREVLALPEGEDTSADLQFTIEKATCIGACNIAPVSIVNGQVHSTMDQVKVTKLLNEPVDEGKSPGSE